MSDAYAGPRPESMQVWKDLSESDLGRVLHDWFGWESFWVGVSAYRFRSTKTARVKVGLYGVARDGGEYGMGTMCSGACADTRDDLRAAVERGLTKLVCKLRMDAEDVSTALATPSARIAAKITHMPFWCREELEP